MPLFQAGRPAVRGRLWSRVGQGAIGFLRPELQVTKMIIVSEGLHLTVYRCLRDPSDSRKVSTFDATYRALMGPPYGQSFQVFVVFGTTW